MSYGRPLKGKERRFPITIHTTQQMLDHIDAYVDDRASKGEAYSRSDFFNEAAETQLQHLGRWSDQDEDKN